MLKAFLVPYTNTIRPPVPCVVTVKREIDEGKMFSTLQFSKGIKKKEPTFLATLKMEEEFNEVQAPKVVQKVLEEFKDVMPVELLNRLSLRRKVNHAIELEPRLRDSLFSPTI